MKSESEKVSLRIISTKELLKRNNKLLYQLQVYEKVIIGST